MKNLFLLFTILITTITFGQTRFKPASLVIGAGSDVDMTYVVDRAGSNDPKLKWDGSTFKWYFSNDGTTFGEMVDKTYVDTAVAAATIPDADSTTKGKIQLAGDLSGTAASPTVPGLALKAPIASPTFTGTVSGITKSMVGLGSVDNTSDASKPVSTAQQTALNLKADLASPALTGTPTAPTPSAADNSTKIATTAYVDTAVGAATIPDATTLVKGKVQLAGDLAGTAASPTVPGLALKAPLASPALTGTPTAPTATGGTNTTQIATTAFVTSAVSGVTVSDATTSSKGIVQLAGDLAGTAASPTVPNKVTGPASSVASEIVLMDGTTGKLVKSATGTGFVKATSGVYSTSSSINLASDVATSVLPLANGGTNNAMSASAGGIAYSDALKFNFTSAGTTGDVFVSGGTNAPTWNTPTGTGAVVKAVSPALTGSPTAPTQTASDNSTKIATTAYVDTADALDVKLTGNQSIAGTKTFTGKILASSTTTPFHPCPTMTIAQILATSGKSLGDCAIESSYGYQYNWDGTKWSKFLQSGIENKDVLFVQDFDAALTTDFSTLTGWAANLSSPLNGPYDLKVTHASSVTTYTVKQIVSVPQVYRNKNMTFAVTGKSQGVLGNVKLTIRDETNSTDLTLTPGTGSASTNPSIPLVDGYTVLSGDTQYFTFDVPSTCASISYKIDALPTGFAGIITEVDDISMYLTKFSSPTSGLVADADSVIRLDGLTSLGSTATKVIRFTTLTESKGSAITYVDSAANGTTLTANTDGTYTVICQADLSTANSYWGISKNASSLTTFVNADFVAFERSPAAANYTQELSWTGPLKSGDIMRCMTDGSTSANPNNNKFVMSYQGSLKQVSINKNSKITIPYSEIKFTGASTRGGTDTNIVKFDTLSKLVGDAFSYVNTTANGTAVTLLKGGTCTFSGTVLAPASAMNIYLQRNSTGLDDSGTVAAQVASASNFTGASWRGKCSTGDVFRIGTPSTPSNDANVNSFNLILEEDQIQVGVSNTLPQFSETDSVVDLYTGNGDGSTNADVRRFVTINPTGTAITCTDSATLGTSCLINESGNYTVSYSDQVAAAAVVIGLAKNQTVFGSIAASDLLCSNQVNFSNDSVDSCSWTGRLVAGDVVRAVNNGLMNTSAGYAHMGIAKVGKANVTGVNVTPFVNVPQVVSHTVGRIYTGGGFTSAVSGALTTDNNGGLLAYNSSTGIFTALKACTVDASFSGQNAAGVFMAVQIAKNGTLVTTSDTPNTAGANATTSANLVLAVGDTFNFQVSSGTNNIGRFTATAKSISDTALTATETFYSDTASLTYAGSGTYTLSTLANAPVGTFITYTYASSSNTRTQTTTAPTQTTSDMNANGIQLFTRAYNAASTAGSPAAIAIQVGKNFKGFNIFAYKSTGKSNPLTIDMVQNSSTLQEGVTIKTYNESTGILTIDPGRNVTSTTTSAQLRAADDDTATSSGYFVITASKSPALTGVGSNVVSARAASTSGQSIANSGDVLVQWDSASQINNGGGLITGSTTYAFFAPDTGIYSIGAKIKFASALYAAGNIATIKVYKNGVLYSTIGEAAVDAAVTRTHTLEGDEQVRLQKGDYIDIRVSNNRTAGATALSTTAGDNFINVFKLGGIN